MFLKTKLIKERKKRIKICTNVTVNVYNDPYVLHRQPLRDSFKLSRRRYEAD